MATLTSSCPRNCYSTCGLRVEVADGRLRRIASHPDNRATGEGLCLKGQSAIERVYAPDRLLFPLARNDGGGFTRISWDQALARIADQLQTVKSAWGAQSVLFAAGSGTKGLLNGVALDFWRLFGGCTTTYGDLCWPAGLEATRLTLGESKHNPPWDMTQAQLIILWGKNPAETNIHQMGFIHQALDRGARLIVIDPRRTASAESAELVIQIRPGTDGALALGIANLLISQDAIDRPFIRDHVHGFEQFGEMVREYTPELVAGITDIPEQYILFLAQAIATTRPITICAGYGMQRYSNGGQTVRALIALLAITGNLIEPGSGWVYANLQSYIFGPKDPLAAYPPPPDRDDPIRVSVSSAKFGSDILAASDPPLRFAWIERGNPLTQSPDSASVLRALRSLDFRVVVDQFLTDTAREADLVLPAKSMFEQSDVITGYWHPYIQIRQRLIEPPGEVKPESEIYNLLARRLGLEEAEIARSLPADDGAVDEYLRKRLAPFPFDLERLRQGPVLAPGSQEAPWSDLVFATPSGKIELVSEQAEERWGLDRLPRYAALAESPDQKYPLHLLTPNSASRIHSQGANLAAIREIEPGPEVLISPGDAQARGIAGASLVRVFNDRGSIEVTARIDHSLRPGCVVITNGWWHRDGAAVNLLSAARETDMGHGAAFHDNAVEITRA